MPLAMARNEYNEPVSIVFPRRDVSVPGGWLWDEVEVIQSDIEGFGLAVDERRDSGGLDWEQLRCHVYVPLLGRETELPTAEDAELFAKILRGGFVAFSFSEIVPAPMGYIWLTDGQFVELLPCEESSKDEWRQLAAEEVVLQVMLTGISRASRDATSDSQDCIYILKSAALELLHMPEHVFALLAAHHRYHHVDRHFATHTACFRRGSACYTLTNAHPLFQNAAFAAGCINEPLPREKPSMVMRVARLRVRHEDMSESARAHWEIFTNEFPEVLGAHLYFITLKKKYRPGEELTASYGSEYHRAYGTGKFDPPPTARVPLEEFAACVQANVMWPTRVPGWWNPSMQPRRRPAFHRTNETRRPRHAIQLDMDEDEVSSGEESDEQRSWTSRFAQPLMQIGGGEAKTQRCPEDFAEDGVEGATRLACEDSHVDSTGGRTAESLVLLADDPRVVLTRRILEQRLRAASTHRQGKRRARDPEMMGAAQEASSEQEGCDSEKTTTKAKRRPTSPAETAGTSSGDAKLLSHRLSGAPSGEPSLAWSQMDGHIEDDMWEVERLLQRRRRWRRVEYLVRWKGWTSADDSWVAEREIERSLIVDFAKESHGEAGASDEADRKKKACAMQQPHKQGSKPDLQQLQQRQLQPSMSAGEAVRMAAVEGLELCTAPHRGPASSTGYRGVVRISSNSSGKVQYRAQIAEPGGKTRYLGCYETAEEAALVRARNLRI